MRFALDSVGVASAQWLVACLLLAACGPSVGDKEAKDPSNDDGATSEGEVEGDGAASGDGLVSGGGNSKVPEFPASRCDGEPPQTGLMYRSSIEHEGRERWYDVYFPHSYDHSSPTPLLLNFHGTNGTGKGQALFSGSNLVADEKNFIVVYPDGLDLEGFGPVFDAGHRDFSADPRDDVGFARAIIEDVAAQGCLDRSRVYATGASNGGRMAYRLACEAADVIAAIAPVVGQLTFPEEECEPARPVPVVHYHGTADEVSTYHTTNSDLSPRTIPEMFQLWASLTGCEGEPVETFNQDDVLCETYESCDAGAEVQLCSIEGAGHCWPGNLECGLGESTDTINSSEAMMDFLLRFSLD